MNIIGSLASLRNTVGGWREKGRRIGFVPTLGALHDGHLTLVRRARRDCDAVVVSIFLNPTQFGPGEDLDQYPKDDDSDRKKLSAEGADLLYCPDTAAMYGDGFATAVSVDGITRVLCGAARPGHFQGVATVVTKLLLRVAPDAAYFGEKDYQQLLVIRRLVADLDIPVEIAAIETVRDHDGLALSSRNALLSPAERRIAPLLYQTIYDMAAVLRKDPRAVAAVRAEGRARLEAGGFDRIDYLDVRDAATLEEVAIAERPCRVFVAARLGATRLIDNLAVL